MNIQTCEFVSPKHPDKMCDYIADSILDAYLASDPHARVAVEVMGGHGAITVSGEVTSAYDIDLTKVIESIIGPGFQIVLRLSKQSPEIARGVNGGGAGDQGIMVGYATAETENHMPHVYNLARDLCRAVYAQYPYDGKTQVTIEDGEITTVVTSFQNAKTEELAGLVRSKIQAREYLINPGGEWSLGGFDADSGLTGRKLVVDSYGPNIPLGGGSFSGKDYTKVDRSGAYMARKIAVGDLRKRRAKEVLVKLAYAIGKPDPVMAVAVIDGKEDAIVGYDVTPRRIADQLGLQRPIYAATAEWGHFGNQFPWDT